MTHMDATPDALRHYLIHDHLLDGRALQIRAIRPDDKASLQAGMHRLSPQSVYFRFFRYKHDLTPQELVYFTEIDFDRHVALVAVVEETDLVIGVARYFVCENSPSRSAEITLTVDDSFHGLGVATLLLRHLVRIGRAAGIAEFRAAVLGENYRMLEVLYNMALPLRRTMEDGMVEVHLSLSGQPFP